MTDMHVVGADWTRLSLLIRQTEQRIALWEAEELTASRRWHRGMRDLDRRGLTKPDNILGAMMEVAERGRLWVPEDRVAADRQLLAELYRLRSDMLAATDGSECLE